MKISIVAHYNPNMFPTLYYLAVSLADLGNEIQFLSVYEPTDTGARSANVEWVPVKAVRGLAAKIPLVRSSYWAMISSLAHFKPEMVIGEHEFLIPGLIYGMLPWTKPTRIAGYFCDYYSHRRGMVHVKRWANRLDAYVDVCDLRLGWRKRDWPHMRAKTFVVRQAPLRRSASSIEPHSGRTRVIYTGSRNALSMDKDRLARFLERLCEQGIEIDWYLAGSDVMQSSEQVRAEARSLTDHPLYHVRPSVPKSELSQTLRNYDVGLFWAPLAERDPSDVFQSHYFLSAASNKIGEYLAAGLVVAHTGNPGLSYLPEDVCAPFDPTDPVKGADQLAAAILNRADMEKRREAALRYHLDEMNFETQVAPFIQYVMEGR